MKPSQTYSRPYLSVENWPEEPTEGTITEAGQDEDRFSKSDTARINWILLDINTARIRVNVENTAKLCQAFGDDFSAWKGGRVAISRVSRRIRGRDSWQGVIEPIGGKAKGRKPRTTT